MKHFLALALLCGSIAHAQTGTVEWWPNNDPTKAVDTQAKCDAALKALNVSGAYPCPRVLRVTAKPAPCPAKPANETQAGQCPAGTTGSWTQTRSYTSAAAPTCWAAGAWTPTSPPAGACVAAPVATWTLLGLEDDAKPLTVAPGSTVRYGKGTAWIEKVITGTSLVCWNGEFGSDPAPGTPKQCELRSGGSTTPPATGSARVSWSAPTTNADGTPITDLAGFRVLYGPASGNYTAAVAASAPSVTVSNLPAGRWFFVVKAIDTASNESAASVEVSKTVQ